MHVFMASFNGHVYNTYSDARCMPIAKGLIHSQCHSYKDLW